MKSNFMKALMAVTICLTMAIPDAKASDWSNKEFVCHFHLVEQVPFYEFWNWGKWAKLTVTYTPIIQPEPASSISYNCNSGVEPSRVLFECRVAQSPAQSDTLTSDTFKLGVYTFKPDTTKAQACEAVFKGQNVRKK